MIISIKGKMKGKWGGAKCMGVAFFFFLVEYQRRLQLRRWHLSKDPKRQGLHLVNIQKKSILGREHVKPLKKERPGVLEEKEQDCCNWSWWHMDQSCNRGPECIEPGEPLRGPDFFFFWMLWEGFGDFWTNECVMIWLSS